jgi:hypothetical protein
VTLRILQSEFRMKQSQRFRGRQILLTVAPRYGLRDGSEYGFSNTPLANFTRRMRVTASLILDIGIVPSVTYFFKVVVNNWYSNGNMNCNEIGRRKRVRICVRSHINTLNSPITVTHYDCFSRTLMWVNISCTKFMNYFACAAFDAR